MIVRAPTDLPDGLPFAYDDRLDAPEVDRFRQLFATTWQRLPRRVRKELLLGGDQVPTVLLSYRLRVVLPSGETFDDAMGAFYKNEGGTIGFAVVHLHKSPDCEYAHTIGHEIAHCFIEHTRGSLAQDEHLADALARGWGLWFCATHAELESAYLQCRRRMGRRVAANTAPRHGGIEPVEIPGRCITSV